MKLLTPFALSRTLKIFALIGLLHWQLACSAHKTEIFVGTLIGAGVGAGAEYAFGYHGRTDQYEARNTIISAVVVGLIAAGALAWHYRNVDEAIVELSGKYSRYRLCDSTNDPNASNPSHFLNSAQKTPTWLPEQIGKYSVLLDENTRWVLPIFSKRWLAPETENEQLVSSHFVWEVVQPGYFLSREKTPDLFKDIEHRNSELPSKKKEK
jgi:hypothetical protein